MQKDHQKAFCSLICLNLLLALLGLVLVITASATSDDGATDAAAQEDE